MARGQEEKKLVLEKILEVFPLAFEYEKHIRVPMGDVQIKIQLTAAKDIVQQNEDTALPGETLPKEKPALEPVKEERIKEPILSEDEIGNLQSLMNTLGL